MDRLLTIENKLFLEEVVNIHTYLRKIISNPDTSTVNSLEEVSVNLAGICQVMEDFVLTMTTPPLGIKDRMKFKDMIDPILHRWTMELDFLIATIALRKDKSSLTIKLILEDIHEYRRLMVGLHYLKVNK